MRSYDLEKEFLHKDNCGKGIIYNQLDGKFDVTVELNSSNITEHLLKVTYDELVDLKALSLLQPGVFYRITDYEFTSTDPEVISAGHRFDIIVLALSEDTLSEDARAIQHEFTDEEKLIYSEEEQHYFDNSNLAAWKLKYSLDSASSRFDWAPDSYLESIVFSPLYVGSSYDTYAYSRNHNKDEQGYYAYEKDNDVVYIKSEVATFGEDVFIKNDSGLIVSKTPGKRGWSDSYVLEIKEVDEIKGVTYLYIYGLWGKESANGWDKSSQFYTDYYAFYIEETDPNNFIGKLFYQLYKSGSHSPGDVLTYSEKVYTLNKKFKIQYPNKGDIIEGPVTGSMVTIPDNWVEEEPEKYYDPDFVPAYEGELPLVYWYAGESLDYVKETKEAVKYKGTIYGMVDEFENDCEYDFKNALITGKYSPFDPDLFYYTFTNLGKFYTPLLDSGEKVILYPGTYSFLGNIPFRLYEGNSGFSYIKPDVSNDSEYRGWDLYAAICDTEGYIDEDTGERHYKLDMYILDKKIAHAIKVCEDKQWYTKEVITDDSSKNYKIYSKDSDGNIKEYSLIDRSEGTDSSYYKDRIIWYLSDNEMGYMPLYRAWIYYSSKQWGQLPYDTYSINLNYKKYIYTSGNDFDIHITDNTYAHDLILDDLCGAQYVISDSYSLGVYFQNLTNSYTITWFTLNLNRTSQGNSGSWEFVDYDPNIKFTKPFTITEPMYVYLKSTVLTDSYIDCYEDDVVFSPDIKLSTDSDLWCAGLSVGSDLYSASTFGGITSPRDTSCSYYNADCYRVTLRPGNLYDSRYWIPKVICENVRHSNIKARKCTLQDCYCVVASNSYHYEDDPNKTFLKYVSFSNLQDVDNCKFEDCYTLLVEGTLNSTFGNISNTHIFNCHDVNIQSVADSIFENINATQICHVSQSRLSNLYVSLVCSVNSSNISNLMLCYFTNSNSYGNYSDWYIHYKNIYINGLQDKTIDFAELLGEQYTMNEHPGHCVHIRSEDDLTITV